MNVEGTFSRPARVLARPAGGASGAAAATSCTTHVRGGEKCYCTAVLLAEILLAIAENETALREIGEIASGDNTST